MLMAEQVPAEAWQGDVIGPLMPQREHRSLFATAIIEYCVKYMQKIDVTISRIHDILNICAIN